jgi:pimeloyl-ACP methyl ester carboxylesterase
MTVIEGAGHLAFMEKPAAVNRAIAGFLKEL